LYFLHFKPIKDLEIKMRGQTPRFVYNKNPAVPRTAHSGRTIASMSSASATVITVPTTESPPLTKKKTVSFKVVAPPPPPPPCPESNKDSKGIELVVPRDLVDRLIDLLGCDFSPETVTLKYGLCQVKEVYDESGKKLVTISNEQSSPIECITWKDISPSLIEVIRENYPDVEVLCMMYEGSPLILAVNRIYDDSEYELCV
jgi:hypothetical protein